MRRSPCDPGSAEGCACGCRDLFKFAVAQIAEEVRRLAVFDALLYSFDITIEVAIGDEDIGPAVEVVVEEETSESQSEQGSMAHGRARRLIHKQSVALVMVERHHLVGEIADDDAG